MTASTCHSIVAGRLLIVYFNPNVIMCNVFNDDDVNFGLKSRLQVSNKLGLFYV